MGEDIPVTVTIANAGAADATVVRASSTTWSGSHVFFPSFQWGDLSPFGPGATIAAGATRVVELTGSTFSGAEGNPLVRFTVYGAEGDADDGEGLAGVMVHLSGGPDSFEATTDAGGRFAVPDVPARIYSAYFSGVPDGWIVPYLPVIRVDGSDASADLRVIGVRALSDTLHACDFGNDDRYLEGYPTGYDTARVPGLTGDNWGTVYRDGNGNGWFDEGEGVDQVKVGLVDPDTGKVVAKSKSDASGRVDFTGVPNGIYLLGVYRPWLPVGEETVYVTTQCAYCGWVFEVRR